MLREGGENCLKYIKRGWNRKEERGNKDLKKGGGRGGGASWVKGWVPRKRGGLEPPYKPPCVSAYASIAHGSEYA